MTLSGSTVCVDRFRSRAGNAGIPGEEYLVDNESFLALEKLPSRIVLVGGGYIAAEFSHLAPRAGAHVTILQRGERMLKPFDPDLMDWLMEAFRDQGIDVRIQSNVEAIEKTASGYSVRVFSNGETDTVEADLVVHAAGRVPALRDLNLEAAGDAAQVGPPLTPVSNHDAKVVAAHLVDGKPARPDYADVPSVAFTIPPIASAGFNEEQAREQGLRFHIPS